jgi:hypothetical protein
VQPIDLAVLAEQTGGDEALAREVLELFAAEAPAEVGRLAGASPDERRAIAHKLVGGSRAIGAGNVGRLAAAVEDGSGDIGALVSAVDEACRFISSHLAGPS